jgi:cytochrome P450
LRDDAALIPVAVEESLRFEPPVLFLFRTATQETEIADTPIKPGDRLVTGIASANRDESVFDRANEFRLNASDPRTSLSVPGRTSAWAITWHVWKAGSRSRSSSATSVPVNYDSRLATNTT